MVAKQEVNIDDQFKSELDKLVLILLNARTKKNVKETLSPMFEAEESTKCPVVELFLETHGLISLATPEGMKWLKKEIK